MPSRPPNHNCPCEAHRERISQSGRFSWGGASELCRCVSRIARHPPGGGWPQETRGWHRPDKDSCLPLKGVTRLSERGWHRPKQRQPHKGGMGASCS